MLIFVVDVKSFMHEFTIVTIYVLQCVSALKAVNKETPQQQSFSREQLRGHRINKGIVIDDRLLRLV